MSEASVDIFGGCATRDAFEFDTLHRYLITAHYTRSSLISLYSDPIDVSLDDINLESKFQQQMVYNDLTKGFRKHLAEKQNSFLIIDFLGERHDVLRHGTSCFTKSTEFMKSGYNLEGDVVKGRERIRLWKQSASLFIKEITSCYDPQKIILHKAFWRHCYISNDGKKRLFKNLSFFLKNMILSEYYQFLEKNMPGLKTIEIRAFHASATHKWGLAPFHYQDEYYLAFLRKLDLLIT